MDDLDDGSGIGHQETLVRGRSASYIVATTMGESGTDAGSHPPSDTVKPHCQEPAPTESGASSVSEPTNPAPPPVSPFVGAGLWSTFTYTWMSDLIYEGKKRGKLAKRRRHAAHHVHHQLCVACGGVVAISTRLQPALHLPSHFGLLF
jgi:hypothetical protein